MWGQSALIGVFGSNLVKRGTYLTARAGGATKYEADIRSDEFASSACTTITSAIAVATLDPIGAAGGAAYSALIESDLKRKKNGM